MLERAVILASGPTLEIGADVLTTESGGKPGGTTATTQPGTLEEMERSHMVAVLRQTDWVIDGSRGAAKILGLHPNTLRSRMKKLGLTRTSHERS